MRIGSCSSKTFLRLLDLLLALGRGDLAFLAVAARLDARAQREPRPIRCRRPTNSERRIHDKPGEQAEATRRSAASSTSVPPVKPSALRGERGEHVAEHAAGRVRQRGGKRVQAQRLERAAGGEQHRETGERHRERAAVEQLPGLDAA